MYYRKRRNRMPIVIAILLLAAAGYFAISRLLPEDAASFYFKAEGRNFDKILKTVNEYYISFMEKQRPYFESPYRRRTEVTAEIVSGGSVLGLKNKRLIDMIGKTKLIVDTKRRPNDGTSLSEVDLLLEKSPFLDAELFTDKGRLYFTVPVLMPGKYFSARLDQLGEVYDKFSIPVKPAKVINGISVAEVLKFDKDQFNGSAAKLGGIFKKYIGKETIKYGPEKDLSISGQTVRGKEVLVILDEETANALMRELAAAIAEDDALLSFTYGNIADISSLLDDAGLFRLLGYLDEKGTVPLTGYERSIVNGLNIKKDMETFKKKLMDCANGYRLQNGLQMAVVIDKDGNILDRRLLLDFYGSGAYESFKLDINTGSSNTAFEDGRNRFVKITVSEYGTNGSGTAEGISSVTELQIVPSFSSTGKDESSGNLAMHFAHTPESGGKTGFDLDLDISGKTDAMTLKRNRVIGFNAAIYGDGGSGIVSGKWSVESWENDKTNSVNRISNISVNADLPFLGVKGFSAVLNLAREDRLGIEQFTLPDIRGSEVMDLNAASEADIDRIEMDIMASFGTFYLQNKQIIDALLGL